MPIEIVCDMFEHFALRATLFLSTLPLDKLRELLETIAAEERCKQHAWRLQSQIAKSYALDRRATTICRRCHRDRCRASIGWRTVSFFESTSPRLYSSLPLLFFDTTILYHSLTVFFFTFIYPSAILSPFKSTVLSLCYPFILLLFICWGPGGVIIVTHETSRTIRGASGVTLTENDSHDWSSSHMKRHVHRTEQQVSPPNIVPATKNDPCLVWSVTYIARRNRCRVKQQVSPSNVEKYCACHEKWLSWLILVTDEASLTSRGATSVILQPHQMLCLPRKMTLMIDPRLIWNVIYIARSNKCDSPTSPSIVPQKTRLNCTR